jgi:predicted peptidase
MGASVTSARIRRALIAAAWAMVIAWLVVDWAAHPALVVHPIGTTPSPYGYVELVPRSRGPHPLVIVLHGRGETGDGTDPAEIIDWLPPVRDVVDRLPSPLVDEGAVIVAPQAPTNWDAASLDALLDHVLASHDIDHDRVYVTGLSMGGAGTAVYAAAHPERLAAALPICGAWGATVDATARLGALPVRAFHGYLDDNVPRRVTAEWVAAISVHRGGDGVDPLASYPVGTDATAVFDGRRFVWRAGTSASPDETLTLTELGHAGHQVWGRVYADPATWRWLFAQRRAHAP